jgi:hypothetical protein
VIFYLDWLAAAIFLAEMAVLHIVPNEAIRKYFRHQGCRDIAPGIEIHQPINAIIDLVCSRIFLISRRPRSQFNSVSVPVWLV